MHHNKTLPLLLSALLLVACGGNSEDENMAEPMAEPMAEASVATATEDAVQSPTCHVAGGTMEEAVERPSPLRSTEFAVGGNAAILCYGAPSARGREVMGGLVVYGQPERIGANEPTTLHLTAPATVGGIDLEAGAYSIYAIANADEWEIFINSNWERWGIPLDADVRSSDIGSFMATPEAIDMVETLQFTFEGGDHGAGNVFLEWENTRVSIPVAPTM